MRTIPFFILLLFPSLLRAQSVHIVVAADTLCMGTTANFTATATGVPTPNFQWTVNGAIVSFTDSSAFATDSLNNGDTITCLLTNAIGDTVLASSNSIVITVQSMPYAGVITGYDTLCQGATTMLNDSVAGGIWSAYNDNASVAGGLLTGLYAGLEGFPDH